MRTFQHKVTYIALLTVIMVAATAFAFLWNRSTANIIAGLALSAIVVLMIERVIHSRYTLTSNGQLVIYKGRFARQQAIPINEITHIKQVKTKLFCLSYVLLEYSAGKLTSVQPDNPNAFIKELKRRQQHLTDSLLQTKSSNM